MVEDVTSSEEGDDEILHESVAGGGRDDAASGEVSSAPSSQRPSQVPLPKRRRVTRACDECRRKKIKCDGKQPCTHCTVYSYECTYDQPSHRRRNPGPQYIDNLEHRVAKAEKLLKIFAPHIDLDDPELDSLIRQQEPSPNKQSLGSSSTSDPNLQTAQQARSIEPDLESMVETTGQLGLDERGYWDYYGHSSGMNFLSRLRAELGEIVDPQQGDDNRGRQQRPRGRSATAIFAKAPDELMESPYDHRKVTSSDLPPKAQAQALSRAVLDSHQTIASFLHRPTFDMRFERVYSKPVDQFNEEDRRFVPLLLSIMALGCLLLDSEQSELHRYGYRGATSEGYRYFWSARHYIDMTDCRDLMSLQSIVFLTMFLQSSAKLATCFAFIGVALRAALRIGLHRSFRDSFGPIESEERKRVFWIIRKMDVFVAAMLGLPIILNEDDIDQDFPTEVNDEYLTTEGIQQMPPGEVTNQSAANADFQITDIVIKIVRRIYPIKGFNSKDGYSSSTYSVSYSVIHDIENDLEAWKNNLPDVFKPGHEAPNHVVRAQQLLRVAFAHAQMILYRPFLHYVSAKFRSRGLDQQSYTCAVACIVVSRNVIQLMAEMKRRGFLMGSQWFTMYTAFFAVLSLVFYALENPSDPASEEFMRDAWEGKDILASVAQRSMAADRCTTTLNSLFAKVSTNVDMGKGFKKAKEEPSELNLKKKISQSYADLPATEPTQLPNRAHSFPQNTRGGSQRGQASKGKASRPTGLKLPARQQMSSPAYTGYAQSAISPQTEYTASPVQQQFTGGAAGYPAHPSQQQSSFQYPTRPSDLSAVIFPSQDPFAYPTQPMTSLGQTAGNAYTSSYPNDQYMTGTGRESGKAGGAPEGHIDVQLLGPMPPYGMAAQHQGQAYGTMPNMQQQQQHPQHHHHHHPQQQQQHHVAAAGATASQMWEQARSHGLPMDLDDIFGGEEWRGSMPTHWTREGEESWPGE